MADDKSRATPPEFLDTLQRFLTSTDGQTIEELDEELRTEGVDPLAFRNRVTALVSSHAEEQRLSWRRTAATMHAAIEGKLNGLRISVPQGKAALLARVRELTDTLPAEMAGAYFHKFEEATEGDLPGLVADLEQVILFGGLDEQSAPEK